jgi:ferredoxin
MTARRIAKVTISEGCTASSACEVTCPEVFDVLPEGVRLRAGADAHYESKRAAIEEAAFGCPVEVIQVVYDDGSTFMPVQELCPPTTVTPPLDSCPGSGHPDPRRAAMRFTINITAEDLSAFTRHYVSTSPRVRAARLRGLLIPPAVFIVLGTLRYLNDGWERAIPSAVMLVLWLVLYPLYLNWNTKLALDRLFQKGNHSAYIGDHEVALEDSLIKCKYPGGYAETNFSSIQKAVETEDYIFLYNTPSSAITFPKRCLSAEMQQALKAIPQADSRAA